MRQQQRKGRADLRKGLKAWLNTIDALTRRRIPSIFTLLRLRHPVIALRLLLPGLFIGAVGSMALIVSLNSHPFNVQAASNTMANLWVDADGGSCTRSATLVAYDTSTACSSMQAAMTAAQGGDKVIVKDGTYPDQTIASGTKSSVVSFYAEDYTPATTAAQAYSATTSVYVASLSLSGVDKIHIYGIQATPTPDNSRTDARLTYAGGGALNICGTGCSSVTTTDILVDGFHGRNFFGRVSNVVIDHASFGGWDACYDTAGNHLASGVSGTEDGFRFWQGSGGSATPTDSTLRNSVIHDIIMGVNDSEESSVCTYGSTYGPHADCMQNNGGAGITIENNIFFNCPSSDIQWTPFSGATIGAQTIQNNYFGGIGGPGNGTVLGAQSGSSDDCSNIVVRNNFYNGVGINFHSEGCTSGVGGQIYGNILGDDCWSAAGADYHDNVFETSNTCGTNPRVCTPTFVSTPAVTPNWLATSTPDFHLAASDTCAKDQDAAAYPATDFEGDSRPQGAAADMGPDEYVPAANIWVSTTGDDTTCVRGDSSKPCATFNQAYTIAQPGDTINIAAGTYAAQDILKGSQSQTGPAVITFQCVTAHACTVNGLDLGTNNGQLSGDTPSYLSFDGVDIHGSLRTFYNQSTDSQPTHDSLANMHVWNLTNSGNLITLNSVDNFSVTNSEIGPGCCNGDGVDLAIPRSGAPSPSNITFDKDYIHDMYDTCGNVPASITTSYGACSGQGYGDDPNGGYAHVDGMQAYGGLGVTIENSRIEAINPTSSSTTGSAQSIFMQSANSGTFSNILLQNNMVSCGCGTNTVSIAGPGTSDVSGYVKFLYNSIEGTGPRIYDSAGSQVLAPGTQVIYAGNIVTGGFIHDTPSTICTFSAGDGSTITPVFEDNLWPTESCDPSDINGSPGFTSADYYSPDLHLTASSLALDKGGGAYCPATDIDGDTRPQGSACDIGADEYIASTPDLTPPSTPTGLSKTSSTTSSISLSWNASSDPVVSGDTTSGLAGYNIYRNGSFLTEVVGLTSYTDTGLSPNTSYTYQVSAIDNSSNESAKSTSLSATTDAASSGGSTPASLKGDCNNDGIVNLTDLSILLSHYGQNYSPADFDSNSLVNLTDLSILLSNYGK